MDSMASVVLQGSGGVPLSAGGKKNERSIALMSEEGLGGGGAALL